MIRRVFAAETIKLRRSPLLILHAVVLAIYPLVMAFYDGQRCQSISAAGMVMTFFELIAVVSPVLISIVVSMVYDREKNAGSFKNMLAQPMPAGRMIRFQLGYYWMLYAIEVIGSSALFLLWLWVFFRLTTIPAGPFLLTAMAFALLGLAQYFLAQLVVVRWGVGATLTMGFFGTVIALLGTTVIFDWIWPIVPWAWQIRLVTFWMPGVSSGVRRLTGILYVMAAVVLAIVCGACGHGLSRWADRQVS
jgi:lantibiotic protection ABC transporter MutG family permease subunit